ncbi:hypothetical protein SARC_11253 [Sphaeroforma arctica JP610]|uniref:Uncharacterized protein n=1 Tax=Sphaeroforma arctica JP610 TaxID=667725 RepID=A0A0L0FHI9_9EUKA|nr:hypothetical protein SARC_11253 [Sphaeroforma arctica JP610]KNC76239.1 hypothetical protein SARC_11253 [Sphaeroforma arctica JP610]|eukprot:XP_014150141.1 hypothetical protein SARC_11253 [Sphaeroforma arctica JP610]
MDACQVLRLELLLCKQCKQQKHSKQVKVYSILKKEVFVPCLRVLESILRIQKSWNGNSESKDKSLEKTTASATAKGSVDKSDKNSKSKKADNDKTEEERTTPVIEENVVVAMQEDGEPVHITTYSTLDEDGKNVAHNIDGPEPHQPEFAKDLLPKGVTIKKGAPKQAKRKQSAIPKVAWKWEDEFDTLREPRTFQVCIKVHAVNQI